MPLQDKLDAFKADFEANKAPATVVAALRRATEELIATGQAEQALHVLDRAPAFTLPSPEGVPVRSLDLLARGPLVLVFYRGHWCPYCNLDLQALEAAASEIRRRGATLLAVSPQTPIYNSKARREHQLSFPVLSDLGCALAAAFGVRYHVSYKLQELFKAFGLNLPNINGEASWTLPMPARYVIAPDGLIRYAEVSPDYTIRPDPSELFSVLDALDAGAARLR